MPVSPDHLSPELARAWAKRLHRSLQAQGHPVPLHACQMALANAMGCSQWPGLLAHLETKAPSSAPVAAPAPLAELSLATALPWAPNGAWKAGSVLMWSPDGRTFFYPIHGNREAPPMEGTPHHTGLP
jgi:hypothetical protein